MKTKKKYTGIAQIKERGEYRCVKYRVNYPDQLLKFLQKNFDDVCWLNIYHNRGVSYRNKYSSWFKKDGWIMF